MAFTLILMTAAVAQAASGTWERTWGKDVDTAGLMGPEICTMAASCKGGDSAATLGGEFSNPSGVATDAAGNVYVADAGRNRIQVFDSAGNFLRAWGEDVVSAGPGNTGTAFEICVAANGDTCKAGTTVALALGGELSQPAGIIVGADGNVYVADTQHNRIQKFSSMGVWERTWGKDVVQIGGTGDTVGMLFEVCTVMAECKAGVGESGKGGDFDVPQGIATDASSNVYVADTNSNRIQKFSSLGVWDRAWGRNVVLTGGTGDTVGDLFEVCVVASECRTGQSGGLGGALDRPRGIAADAGGTTYVADSTQNRLQKFSSVGAWDRAWGRNVDNVTAEPGFETCTTAADCKIADASAGLGGELSDPRSVAIDAAGRVYVADRQNRRIQSFGSTGAFLATWGRDVVQIGMPGDLGAVFETCTVAADCQQAAASPMGLGGELNAPLGVGSTGSGIVYVADTDFHRIQKFADPLPPVQPPANGTTPTTPKKKCKKGRKLKKGKCVRKKRKKK